jgi:NitT/TauT family transport system substrate-binding protein
MRPRTIVWMSSATVLACTIQLMTSALLTPRGARAADPVRIVVAPMTPSPVAWAAYFIAKPLGYYAAESLDVDVIKNPPRGSQTAGVLTGQILFGGVSSTNNMPNDAVRGRLKWFLSHEMFPFGLMVLDGSPVKSAAELKGKTIAMRSANDEPAAKIMMAGGNVNPGEYKSLVVGPGVPGAAALRRGAADGLVGTAVDQMEIEASGVKLRHLGLGTAEGLYNGGLLATTAELSKNRDVAVRFGRALTKAYIWVYENPDATLDILARVVPEAVQDREAAKRILLALNESNRSRYDAGFRADPAVYQRQIELEVRVGILQKSFPADEIFTNDLMDEIWSFDVNAVKARARGGK